MPLQPLSSELAACRHQRLHLLWQRWQVQAIASGQTASAGQFARAAGLSPSLLSQYRAGKPMGSRVARQLEAASHVPPGWLDDATSSQVHWLGDQASDTLLHTLGPGAEWIMPLVDHRTPAGFPSPAADYETTPVNLLSNLQLDQAHTFMARISGQSMVGKGIDDGDLIVINRSLTPKHGHTVVALLDNELTCKTLYKRGAVVKLQAANPEYPDIVLKELQSLTIWGVVTSVIKPMAY